MSTVALHQIKHLFTHAGVFHADDLFSTALLRILGCEAELQRVVKVPENMDPETDLVFDIGMGPFDHHQADKAVRENGIPYAAFGLLMREFFQEESEYELLEHDFIQEIDAADNGTAPSALSRALSSFNRNWNEDSSPASVRAAFDEATFICIDILQRVLATAKNNNANQEFFSLDRVCTEAFLQMTGHTEEYQFINRLARKGVRENGIPYGNFGFIVKAHWQEVFEREQEYLLFDKTFVQDIDAVQAGTGYSLLDYVTFAFNPIPGVDFKGECGTEVWMALLQKEVNAFQDIIGHVIKRINAAVPAEKLSLAAAESAQGGVAFMDRFVPVRTYLADDPRVNWIGYPSLRGGYSLATFRDGRGEDKALHPAQFCGLAPEELPEGMKFCHPDGFIAEFVDRAHAEAYAKQYLMGNVQNKAS